jgi:hypothetical protein
MIRLSHGSIELRKGLVIEGQTISAHCDIVMALNKNFRHAIRCVDRPAEGTCLTYALGLLDQFRPLCAELQAYHIKPGREFVQWLLDNRHLGELRSVRPGALALHFDGRKWMHAGITLGTQRIRSKWGTYAAFEHELSEVPANYGDVVRIYRLPSCLDAANLFFQFGCLQLELSHPVENDRLRQQTGMSYPADQ